MKMFHIDDFKCTLCSNWFCPPFTLPYLLPCTHSICTHCLKKASSNNDRIICPQDLQSCNTTQINLNTTTKKALQRLMKQHKNYNQNTQLQCIKALSLNFDQTLASKQKKISNLEALIDQIFYSEIDRLKNLHEKIKQQLNRPYRIVQDWKQVVTVYLTNLRNNHKNNDPNKSSQLFHYIEQGRKIKMELYEYFSYDFDLLAKQIMKNSNKCFQNKFSMWQNCYKINTSNTKEKSQKSQKFLKPQKSEGTNFLKCADSPMKSRHSVGLNTHKFSSLRTDQVRNFMDSSEGRMSLKDLSNLVNDNTGPVMLKKGKILQLSNKKSELFKPQQTTKQVHNFQELIGYEIDNNHSNSSEKSSIKNRSSKRQIGKIVQKQFNLSQFQLENNIADYCQQKNKQAVRQSIEKQNFFGFPQPNSYPYADQKQDKTISRKINFLFDQGTPQNVCKTSPLQKSKTGSILLASPQTIKEQYTEQAQQPNQQLLLISERQPLQIGSHNFLKEWQIKRQHPEQELQIRQKGYYNCQRQKMTYMRKMQLIKAQQAYQMTTRKDDYIQLINQSLHDIDMSLYLAQFDWSKIKIIKLVKTSITDEQLNTLLNYIVNLKVQTLVLSGNNLSDHSLDAFLNFVNINKSLKSVCLAKNYINGFKARPKINILRQRGIVIYM